jgi:hypothetical protein
LLLRRVVYPVYRVTPWAEYRAQPLAEKLYPEKSDKVYGIESVYSSVSPFFMREYPGEEQELVLRHTRIVAYATPIL